MEITYIAHSCFKIKGKDASIVIDPYDPKETGYKLPKLSAEIVLSSHDHSDHNYVAGVEGADLIVQTPGEYESKDIYIDGIPTYHDDKQGSERGRNTIFQIHMEDLRILHLGDLGHELTKETGEKLGEIDVLFIPVGGKYTIDAETATKVISYIEPGIVVPMHYKTKESTGASADLAELKVFLEEMGVEKVTEVDRLKVTKGDIPEETQVIVITPTNQ